MHCQTAADLPWYLEPGALAIIAGISTKPAADWSRDILGRPNDGRMVYVGRELAALQRYWTVRFKQIDAMRPWPEATMAAVCMCASEQDVLAALFGSPNYEHAETEAKRAAIREELSDALANLKLAA